MSRLKGFKVWHRLLAAALMLCIPLAMLVYFLVSGQNADIAFARKEITGVEHLTAVSRLVSDIQEHRGLARRWLEGDGAAGQAVGQTEQLIEQGFAELAHVEERYSGALRAADERRALHEKWTALREDWMSLDVDQAWARHGALVENGLAFIRHLGNASNLILDPAVDSYYLMDIAVNRLPTIADSIGHLRGIGGGAAASKSLTGDARDDMLVSYTRLRAELRELDYDFAIIADSGGSPGVIERPLAEWRKQFAAFEAKVVKRSFENEGRGWAEVDPAVYFDEATAVIGGVNSLFDRIVIELVVVLERRIEQTEKNRNFLAAGILAAFLTAVVLGTMLVSSVTRPLARAVAVFRRIEDGHYDNEIDMAAGGEPLEVLQSLAAMQKTMGAHLADQRHDQAELQNARDDLEHRVDERTNDLMAANVHLVEEIVERKQAEAALRESEETLARAQAVARVGSWRWSIAENKLISCSAEYARIHGVGPDEIDDLMAEQIERSIHPDDRERVEAAFRRFDEDGGDFEIEYRIVRPDGEVRHIQEIGKPVVNDMGPVVEHIGTVQDITVRKLAEAREAEAHVQLADAIESISDGFILFDAAGRLVLCNSRYREFYREIDDLLVPGATFESIVEQAVERGQIVVPLDDAEGWLAMRLDQYHKGRGTHEQLLAGGRWVEVTEHRTSTGGLVGIRTDITERRRTAEALRENRRRLTNAQRIAKLGHWDFELVTERLSWSDELFNIFQIERKDFDGTSAQFYERVHPDDRDRVWRTFTRALDRGEPYSLEHRIVLPNGTVRHIREEAEIVVDDRGEVVGVSGTAQDVTERKAAEERFRTLLESAPDAMVIIDDSGTIVLVNAQTEALFGYPREDLLGKKVEMLLPKSFRTRHRKHRTGFFNEPRLRPMGQSLELLGLARDGREFPVEISLGPIEAEEGCLVSAAVRDITERKQAEQAVRDSEARLRQAQEIARIGDFEWDEVADEAVFSSDVIFEFYGVTRENAPLTVEATFDFIHPDDHDRVREVYAARLGTGKGYELEYRLVRPNGEVGFVREISNPVFDASGVHVRSVGTFQDITESRRAEQAIRDSEARLRRA